MSNYFTSRRRKRLPLGQYQADTASDLVEDGALPLVDALNVEDICETIASCEGHLSIASRSFYWPPYVFFRAPAELVKPIAAAIHDPGRPTGDRTYYEWEIRGHFHYQTKELVWTIEAQDVSMLIKWKRARIDDDFRTLAGIATRCVSTFCGRI